MAIGFSMLALLGYGLWAAVPNREAVEFERAGVRKLKAGNYLAAEEDFVAVLHREPKSMHARLGLACGSFLTGHRSRAALELTLALENGLPLAVNGDCSHNLHLDRIFFVAKFGLTDSFAVPRVAGAASYEQMLTSEPELTDADEAARLLVGSCLSFRAELDGAGWYYAANAATTGPIGPGGERHFLRCLGDETLKRLHCDRSPAMDCLLSARVRKAYLNDRERLYRS
jgi:hypothetical protein